MTAQIIHGNNLDVLPAIPDCSIDSIVTDPPYELGFMGKAWDASGIAYNVELWRECLRVLKPGGHLLAFGGTRTYHRMAVAIEDAGFEIRDSIHWLYGSGFPKSLDVSKAIDKAGGASPADQAAVLRNARERAGLSREEVAKVVGGTVSSVRDWEEGRARTVGGPVEFIVPSAEYRAALADLLGYTADERRVTGGAADRRGDGTGYSLGHSGTLTEGGNTDAAKQWSGWGTALKPAHEPIVLARKPLDGTVAHNVLTYGTGALNIDGTRIAYQGDYRSPARADGTINSAGTFGTGINDEFSDQDRQQLGRWPANVIHDGHPDIVNRFPTQTSGANPTRRNGLGYHGADGQPEVTPNRGAEQGTAARFFAATPYGDLDAASFVYVAKPSTAERNAGLDHLKFVHPSEVTGRKVGSAGAQNGGYAGMTETPRQNFHPTVKPLALMRYLIRLVTPPGGIVLEPFAGSGTTLAAATLEGMHSIGIELTDDYLPIIHARVEWAEQQAKENPPSLF